MSQAWQEAAAGAVWNDGSLSASEATAELITHKIQEVSYGIAVTSLDGQAVFQLEGRIGDTDWFSIPDALATIASDPDNHSGNQVLRYDHCATISAIRLRFVSATGDLVPVARVLSKALQISE
jgi:hypothetical protein